MEAGDAEMAVSKLLENLTEDQIEEMISQAWVVCGPEVREELEQICPV